MLIIKETNSDVEFLIWIPELKFSTLLIYDIITIRDDLIEMTQIQTRTHRHQISEMLAMADHDFITDPYSRWLYGTSYQTWIFTNEYR